MAVVSQEIPHDVVCEILKHCHGVSWGYRELARLCLVGKRDWLPLARRALYRDLRLDYRHEIELLSNGLVYQPDNRSLIRSLVVNGDAAHVPNILPLIASLPLVNHVTFFDFELICLGHQTNLCGAFARNTLTSLSFQVLPADFVTEALRSCALHLERLYIYRVNLSSAEGWEPDCTWNFPKLEKLELWHVGALDSGVFSHLAVKHASQLRRLCFVNDGPRAEMQIYGAYWLDCDFANLEYLELRHFTVEAVQSIMHRVTSGKLHTLKLEALHSPQVILPLPLGIVPREPPPPAWAGAVRPSQSGALFDDPSDATPTASSADDAQPGAAATARADSSAGVTAANARREMSEGEISALKLLASLPPSIHILQIKNLRQFDIACALLYLFSKASWLPKLRLLPRITLTPLAVMPSQQRLLKKQAYDHIDARGFTLEDDDLFFDFAPRPGYL